MTITGRISVLLPVIAVAIAACTAAPPAAPAPSSPPVQGPSAESRAGDAALAAYNDYWAVVLRARAAPGAQDWTPEITSVASGEALTSLSADLDNYADLPAHYEGTVGRSPAVENAATDRVTIIDCLDLRNYMLRADQTGELLTDTANQVPRFRYRTVVVPNSDGRWLVDETTALLGEPC